LDPIHHQYIRWIPSHHQYIRWIPSGVPVYLSGGIIITGATQESLGFWNAVMLSTFVCYGLKLIAVVLQQLLIGGGLRQSAAVRQMVGVYGV
jgi:hypothetical protein